MANPATVALLLLDRCESLIIGTPRLEVAMPDVKFTPPVDERGDPLPYLRVSFFSNAPAWEGLADGRMDMGLLQITVVWPERAGIIRQREVAQVVMSAFPKGHVLHGHDGTRVKFNRAPWAASPLLGDKSTETPITISWTAA
jgi:hypothetical protein